MAACSSLATASNQVVTSKSKLEQGATTSAKSTTTTRTNVSAGLASTLVQSDTSTASLSAVNADKFASSLRESSATAAAVGQHKEISVIDHHRKQSLQKQSRAEW